MFMMLQTQRHQLLLIVEHLFVVVEFVAIALQDGADQVEQGE